MVDVEAFAKVAKGLPFWFAGSYGKKDKLCDVLEGGGNGVQVWIITNSLLRIDFNFLPHNQRTESSW